MTSVDFDTVAVLPEPGDNVAIVSTDLAPGTVLRREGGELTVGHRVLEGHRIVVEPVADGAPLLSWSTPFARAVGDLSPGDYVCTETSLQALGARGVDGLPDRPTAVNQPLDPYQLDESALQLGSQVDPVERPATFLGYARSGGLAGTRNHAVVLGVTSRTGPFVTELARRFAGRTEGGFDGVVPVAHTEGGEAERPNNAEFVLRTLAGFLVHPNVGAVLVVDEPHGTLTAADVVEFVKSHGYPEITVPHAFFTRSGSFAGDMDAAAAHVEGWIPGLVAQQRTEQPLSDLKIALQCGGSDAFSGITANPLAGAVAREVIRHGGAAVLAETDELIGAERYVLQNVRDVETARRFLRAIESFKERASWHGATAEGNPSGGNIYRGLYNIVLKSIGAGRKRDRSVRLDHVVDYAEPIPGPGFVFMDSPGNDLESVAGEVASGCTMIFFTTGNGSITNFPFVPTLKYVTTTPRYELLRHEMDVDAGRYLTGTPMDQLTAETFDLTVATASGSRSAGERAGHSQVSIWRNWKQTRPRQAVPVTIGRPGSSSDELDSDLDGRPLRAATTHTPPAEARAGFPMYETRGGRAPEQVALVLPTSLCSGQIGLRLAAQANQEGWHGGKVDRAVSLAHTEGCGVASGSAETTYARVMTGYLAHPNVRMALLLEHGCEKTHNDYFRAKLDELGIDPAAFGWASIQRDGGIDAVGGRVAEWFEHAAGALDAPMRTPADLGHLSVALDARGPLRPETARAFATLGGWVVASGGTVVLPSAGGLLADAEFRQHAFGSAEQVAPTLAHGQQPAAAGWHVMRTPTTDWTETGSGLGATGAQLLLVHVAGGTLSGQPLLPVVQVTADPATEDDLGRDLDGALHGDTVQQSLDLLHVLVAVASGEQVPQAVTNGNIGFQITRGLLGISM